MNNFEKNKIFQAEIENIPQIRKWIIEQIIIAKLPPEALNDIKCAISEALTNIALYAYQNELDKPIEIKVLMDAEQITISFQDFGEPCDFRNYIPPDLNNPTEGGYGIYLMHKLMDGIRYHFSENGTNLLMWKCRHNHEK